MAAKRKASPKNYLVVNDPRSGWANAAEVKVKSPEDAWDKVQKIRKTLPKYEFMLRWDGTLWVYKGGRFIHIVSNVPLYVNRKY